MPSSDRTTTANATRLLHEKPIPLRLTPEERRRTLECAAAENRSASNFARMVYMQGLDAYQRSVKSKA